MWPTACICIYPKIFSPWSYGTWKKIELVLKNAATFLYLLNGGDVDVIRIRCVKNMRKVIHLAINAGKPVVPFLVLSQILRLPDAKGTRMFAKGTRMGYFSPLLDLARSYNIAGCYLPLIYTRNQYANYKMCRLVLAFALVYRAYLYTATQSHN